jgi:hypothetical protein
MRRPDRESVFEVGASTCTSMDLVKSPANSALLTDASSSLRCAYGAAKRKR